MAQSCLSSRGAGGHLRAPGPARSEVTTRNVPGEGALALAELRGRCPPNPERSVQEFTALELALSWTPTPNPT